MRAGIVAIVVFAALLALGHYVAAPVFCRGSFAVPSLDPAALCGADLHLNRSGSVLLYFASIAGALFFGVLAALIPARKSKPSVEPAAVVVAAPAAVVAPAATNASSATPLEQALANAEQKAEALKEASADAPKPADKPAEAMPAEAKPAEAMSPEAMPAEAKPAPQPADENPLVSAPSEAPKVEAAAQGLDGALVTQASVLPAHEEIGVPAIQSLEVQPAAESEPAPPPRPIDPVAQAAHAAVEAAFFPSASTTGPGAIELPPSEPHPETLATADAISESLAARRNAGPFDGTNEELMQRFLDLKAYDDVGSIAQAQRLLDESTMAALSRGVDPKAHLSQIAHLVLTDDPDLKSAVVRGVVVHVAARLKELGVAKPWPEA